MKRTGTIPGAENFTYEEFFASSTAEAKGIDNVPDDDSVYDAIEYLAVNVLQPVREHFGKPIYVSSGYRCPRLNKAVGGAATSHHLTGAAADIRFNRSEKELHDSDIFSYIANSLPFTELIAENISASSGWIHAAILKGKEEAKAIKYMLASDKVVKRSSLDEVLKKYERFM